MQRDATHPRRGDALARPLLDKVVVIGVGLIGGSFYPSAEAWRWCWHRRWGRGERRRISIDARRLGIADRTVRLDGAWTTELRDADLVLVATPVGQMAAFSCSNRWRHIWGASTVVTDAGST